MRSLRLVGLMALILLVAALSPSSPPVAGVWLWQTGHVSWALTLTPQHIARAVFSSRTDDNPRSGEYLNGTWHTQADTLFLDSVGGPDGTGAHVVIQFRVTPHGLWVRQPYGQGRGRTYARAQ